jgi:hypothetical protein
MKYVAVNPPGQTPMDRDLTFEPLSVKDSDAKKQKGFARQAIGTLKLCALKL